MFLQFDPDFAKKAREERLRREAQKAKKGKPEPKPVVEQPRETITSNLEFWTIPNVKYRGETQTWDLAKSLLLSGKLKTQDEWAKHYELAKPNGEFHTPDYPLFYAILKSLRSQNAEEVRKFLQGASRDKWLMTLTRIAYRRSRLDLITHNYGTNDWYKERVDFITPSESIKDTQKPESYQKLLDTLDRVGEINEVFRWLNGTDAYAWKVNSKPQKIEERVARFNAFYGWVNLGCGGSTDICGRSLGVRQAKILGGNN